MRKTLIVGGVLCLAVTARAELTVYPAYPAAIERDDAYEVSVAQGATRRRLVVYNHCEKSALTDRTRGGDVNRRFCEFAFAGEPVRVDIAVREDVRAYKVFPARRGLRHSFADGVISVWLEKPAYFGVQLNDYDKTILSVFADAPERDAPKKGAPGVLYVDGWTDGPVPTGVIESKDDVREIYVAPGAVLNARLKIRGKGTYLHGRGMILDPMSDVFRYDQSSVVSRGLVGVSAPDCRVDGVKLVDARTFNFIGWSRGLRYTNVKVLSSMMCSDGLTCGGSDLLADNAWLYVGDNALVVSGVKDAVYRNVAIGTSCKAVFPQGTNRGVKMENIDVFRADEGVIANVYNGALRRNNKWNEMNAGKQKREPGPQDLVPQAEEFFFDGLSAVDATYVGYLFRGYNMGDLPKTFGFCNLSVPHVPGRAGYRGIGKTNGVSVAVMNDPKKWLITHNYALTVTNLYLAGKRVAAFPPFAVQAKDETELRLAVVECPDLPRTVPLAADRTEVNWTCPAARRRPLPSPPANLLEDRAATRSIWQRVPSWLVKFDACRRDEKGAVVYRLFQCEKGAGLQAVITERVKAAGFGRYRLSFDVKATSETPFGLTVSATSNEKSVKTTIPEVELGGDWTRRTVELDLAFDQAATDLVSLKLAATATANEVLFRNFKLTRE